MKLSREYFNRDTIVVAKELLGNFFVHKTKKGVVKGKIVEVEAYCGIDDLACHASRGITPHTKTLFDRPGQLYVYLNYGIFWLTNVVAHEKDGAGGILIRAVEIIDGKEIAAKNLKGHRFVKVNEKPATGPGKFSVALGIDGKFNQLDITNSETIYIEKAVEKLPEIDIIKSKRIGVDYAQHCKNYLWRFYIKDNKFVSRK